MPNYSYNGFIYPELKWDNVSYPYVYISQHSFITAYALAQPLSDVTESMVGYSTYARQPFMRAQLKSDENNREYWGEWEYVTENEMVFLHTTTDWTNHNILMADGSIFLSASEPSPVTYPIVIVEDELDGLIDSSSYFFHYLVNPSYTFATGDRVKITLNGVSGEYVVKKDPAITNMVFIGNAGVRYDDVFDDGGDWLFTKQCPLKNNSRTIHFLTRTDGTYQIKIELLAPEPEEPERPEWKKHDAYKPNTKWDGNTFYKVIGNKWVKHDAVAPAE